MDGPQLSRWTRFASKGGIGKCVALQDCVAEAQGDLMFLKNDEIIVLMQIPDEDGIYLGYCEGVVGRFAAAYVQFIGRLKTPVITKRSSTSKSPRPRSLTPSRRQQQPSPTPAPSLSRVHSLEEDHLPHAHSTSSAPFVPEPLPLGHRQSSSEASPRSDAYVEPSHHDLFVTPSMSYSSSSSAPESASPPTPSDFFVEPYVKDKTAPSVNEQPLLDSPTHPLRQDLDPRPAPHSSTPGTTAPGNPLAVAPARSQSSDRPASNSPHDSPSPSPTRAESRSMFGPRLGTGDTTSVRLSHLSAAMSDGAAGIGLSMLHGFVSGYVDEDDDEEDDEDSDHDRSCPSDHERTSLEETVDDFPAPPTQIPTPCSRATSFYSEDGDGASFYDNYRYSRLSISSKMSKSSCQTVAAVPPPVPTDPPPPVRHSQDSLSSAPVPPSESLPSASETASATRTVPPPLILANNLLGSEPPDFATATTVSPLLHTNFASPQSSPPIRSPMSASFDVRGSGAASALRQRIESDCGISSPLASPLPSTPTGERTFEQLQSIVVEDTEDEAVSVGSGTQPQSPTSPIASSSSSKSEKKKRGGPAPLVVMNQAPPPPYTPRSPDAFSSSPAFNPMPTHPTPTHPVPSPPSQTITEPNSSPSPATLFLPHPNAPKPSATPQRPLYGRTMTAVPIPPPSLLIQTLKIAAQVHIGPNGLPRFSTVYAITPHDLSAASGPVPIYFSVNPPNDVPANRVRMATPTAQSSAPSQAPGERRSPAEYQPSTPTITPRANFFPNAATARRRSRSFSGFDSRVIPGAHPKEQSRDKATARPSTADSSPRSSLSARAAAHTARIHQARQHTPSPLALSRGTSPSATTSAPHSPSHPKSSSTSPTVRRTLSPVKSEPSLRASQTRPAPEREALPQSPVKPDAGSSRVASSQSSSAPDDTPPSIQIAASESQVGLATRGALGKKEVLVSRQLSSGELRGKTSMSFEASSHGDARSQVTTSPPPAPATSSLLGRTGSLRSRISLSALRAKSLRDDKQQDDGLREGETVQVKDMDFELVRPNVARPRASEDSFANGKNSGSEGQPLFLRVDSPATSMTSGASGPRSPVSPSIPTIPSGAATGPATGVGVGAVEAHRARELKWISSMASTTPVQARKSKKIRKLLQEGVPASVRYQVWAHLTDSKAKRIEGLYVQLGDREKVSAFAEIQRDAQRCFPGDARLSQPNGALASLLQSYLTMVPDIQYSQGLAFIAGQLLLQSPEEDAFWIFISLMDLHLRPYFSSNAVQLDIDASLFAKAMEAIDPVIAKKLFIDMAIAPIRVCRPWFTSLFVEALPTDYFQRVWDIFLCEGMVFLLRIGLALVTCCHRALLNIHQETEALNLLLRPPQFLISSSPDSLIELAYSFRLKDDDIRKQRIKLEAQVKRQTQSRLSNAVRRSSSNSNGGPSATISLPRS
ncbi:rab-GTPase-TBC domain-containing protein [Lactifluus subvellereus]|nr:rab-GTPase-TBC domain-containing protein [Lactifluus subvellereus]